MTELTLSLKHPPLTILVADDHPANQSLLKKTLSSAGHTVITASSGEEAVERYKADEPDVVLMDVVMPGIGGIEATRQMRALASDHWVPIIFISALSHRDDMVRGLEAGGDDYLSKPVDLVLLDAKIHAMQRIAVLKAKLRASNKELEAYREISEYELDMTRELMEHMVNKSSTQIKNVELWLQPASNLSGDLIIAQQYRNERCYVLLADAMGHGLPAAIPLIPLTQVFSAMTQEGFSVSAIVREMNKQLKELLWTGNFVAVTLLSIDRDNQYLEIWNGGNPTVKLLDQSGEIINSFQSRHCALGIMGDDEFESTTEIFQWHETCSLMLHSDGLIDAQNDRGEDFGTERIIASMRGNKPHHSLKDAVLAHLGGRDASDDISIATISLYG